MFLRIWNLVWKEALQFIRDWMMTLFILMLPILQLVLMAQATGEQISDLRVAVLDMDHSQVSRQLITELNNREELTVWYFVEGEEELRDLLNRGRAEAGIILPRGLAEDLADSAREAHIQVVIDGSNSIVGSLVLGAASGALTEYGQEKLESLGLTTAPPVDLRVITYYNPDYDTRSFTIPAQVGFITYQITLAVASLGLARERELGTLEQLIVTPLSQLELVLGKAVPALIVGALNFFLMMGVAVYIFGVPMRGSLLLLFGVTLLFISGEIGWGVLISAISRTQQQAILLVFIMAMVDITFSGYLVPVKNLPRVLQYIAQAVPMYHYLVVLRSVMLKGASLKTLWPHVVALVGLGVGILGISVRGVSQRLD